MELLILYDMIKKQQEQIDKLTEQNNVNEIKLSYLGTRVHNVIGFIRRITNELNSNTHNQIHKTLDELSYYDTHLQEGMDRKIEELNKNKN